MSVPTHEGVVKVLADDLMEDFYSTEDTNNRVNEELSQLLQSAAISDRESAEEIPPAISDKHWLQEDLPLRIPQVKDKCDFILTAQEMRRIHGHSEPILDFSPDQTGHLQLEEYREEDLEGPSLKRPRLEDRSRYQPADLDDVILNNAGNVYTTQKSSEDSGVFFEDLPVIYSDTCDQDSTFADMTLHAEGYEGPRDDGDMFPDLDPILIDSGYPSPVYHIRPDYTTPLDIPAIPYSLDMLPNRLLPSQLQNLVPPLLDSTQQVQHPETRNQQMENADAPPLVLAPDKPDPLSAEPAKKTTALPAPRVQADRKYDLPTRQTVSAKESLANFLALRSRTVKEPEQDLVETVGLSVDEQDVGTDLLALQPLQDWQIPSELIDKNTLTLSETFPPPKYVHTYLTSMDTLLKRGLARCLASDACSVNLVERDQLDGSHIILDPDTSIVFVPLFSLPSYCQNLTDLITQLSWRYEHILILFEAFPASRYNRRGEEEDRGDLDPFSPPVVKSVKKLKRDLNIAEGMETKRETTRIQFAFATTVKEAALLVRLFGNLAENRDTSEGAIWGPRPWLEAIGDEESEACIANPPSMNHFVAAMILTQTTLDQFLDCSSEGRMQMFAPFVGWERIESFNRTLERRVQFMGLPSSSPSFTSLSSPFLQDGIYEAGTIKEAGVTEY